MKIDLADKGWLQNRLIGLGLLLIISILAVPIAGFSFIDEAQAWRYQNLMIPFTVFKVIT